MIFMTKKAYILISENSSSPEYQISFFKIIYQFRSIFATHNKFASLLIQLFICKLADI